MPKLWDLLSPLNKVKLARLYKKITGFDFTPPKEDKRKIHCEVKIDPKEVERTMKEKPNYTISEQGRE